MANGLKGYETTTSGPSTYLGDVTVTGKPGNKVALDTCVQNTASSPVITAKKTAANIRQVTTPAADTEFTIVFAIGTRAFKFKDQQGNAEIRISTTPGGADAVDTTYYTIPRDASLEEEDLNLTSALTFYCQSTSAGRIIEIWEWT